jgi:polysaccharide export outer membrane protein
MIRKLIIGLAIGASTGVPGLASTIDRGLSQHSEYIDSPTQPATQPVDPKSTDTYILGPGDQLSVELIDIPEYTGLFTIGPDGSLYLPRIRSVSAEGLTINELSDLLEVRFLEFVKSPDVFVQVIRYRPIRVYIGGEILRPGYYFLSGEQALESTTLATSRNSQVRFNFAAPRTFNATTRIIEQSGTAGLTNSFIVPTLFDALRTAGGVTPFSKLDDITVIRDRPQGVGGGKIMAKLNFLALLTLGDESQNIRLFDGDSIVVGRSSKEMREQIIKASQTNLSPDYLQVYVSGRVREPGPKVLPQGASLEQALASAGGPKILRGFIEFIRFNRDGTTDKRQILGINDDAAGSYSNPVLMPGDVIRINNSPISAAAEIVGELTRPALGLYSAYSLFNGFD